MRLVAGNKPAWATVRLSSSNFLAGEHSSSHAMHKLLNSHSVRLCPGPMGSDVMKSTAYEVPVSPLSCPKILKLTLSPVFWYALQEDHAHALVSPRPGSSMPAVTCRIRAIASGTDTSRGITESSQQGHRLVIEAEVSWLLGKTASVAVSCSLRKESIFCS